MAHGKLAGGSTGSTACDVAIVGAGPAGLITARNLAAAGHDVVVLEEHANIGLRCTARAFSTEAFDELDLPRHAIRHRAGGTLRFFRRYPVLVDTERVRASIVDRGVFDQMLADRARSRAEIHTSARVRSISVAADRVVIGGDSGESIQARPASSPVAPVTGSTASSAWRAAHVRPERAARGSLRRPGSDRSPLRPRHGAGGSVGGALARGGQPFNRVGMLCENGAAARFAAFTKRVRERHAATEGTGPRRA